MFTRKAAFEKISKNFETESRTSADVQLSTQIQVKTKKKVITFADVLFFTEIQRRAKIKSSA